MNIELDKYYAVKFGDGYLYLFDRGGGRGSKRSGSIISGQKIMRLPFNVHMAIESGIISLEEIK